jgi:small-conductance mechanosensitive channel
VSGKDLPTGKAVFGVAPRVLAATGSGVAALVIIVGALWSVYRLARHRPPAVQGVRRSAPSSARLVAENLLIAAGTLVLSASGTVAGRLGKDRAFAITLLVGIAVLFVGFLVASTTPRRASVALRQRAA